MKINSISPQEHNFSKVLEKLVLNIKMLYYYGKLPENVVFCRRKNGKCCKISGRPKTVAIVGSRKNTAYGYEVAYKAAYAAAQAGAVVVSGLAYGIDSIAHRGALDAGGITVAVLGTPIDDIYPREHKGLAKEIIEKGGAVISEYGEGERASGGLEMKARFLQRNRIIAGLSDVVLIAEAANKSGSLNTATHALNYGVDLMVAPGDITRESSKGCNRLLAQGAGVYTGPDDLLDTLFSDGSYVVKAGGDLQSSGVGKGYKKAKLSQLERKLESEAEQQVVAAILTGVQSGEEIMERLGMSALEFAQTITILEIKGVVQGLSMNKWMVKW